MMIKKTVPVDQPNQGRGAARSGSDDPQADHACETLNGFSPPAGAANDTNYASRQRAYISTPMSAQFGFIMHSTQTHTFEVPPDRPRSDVSSDFVALKAQIHELLKGEES